MYAPGGATDETIMKSQGINEKTLDRVKKSNADWETYRFLHAQHMQKHVQKDAKKDPDVQIVEHRQSVTLIANQYMAMELQKQTKFLELLNNKVAFIVDELIGPEKKGGSK